MNINRNLLRRPAALLSAMALALGIVAPALAGTIANAAQVTGRSITMSDSTPGATGVVYALTLTLPTAASSMIVDFCAESPIIAATCTAPTGMDALTSGAYTASNPGTNTPVGSGGPGSAPVGWTKGTFTASTLKVAAGTPTTLATKYTFYFTGIKNPTSTGTFYARVYTYSNTTYGTPTAYTSPTAVGSYVDYGGFALSTASNINITATVMETLTFCVSKAAPATGCTGTTAPNVILGHGSPPALDSSATDTDTAYTQISTNAQSGAVVNMKNTKSTTCAGLSRDGGVTCDIAANTAGGAITVGPKFGASVATGAALPTTGSGTTTPIGSWATPSYMSNATYGTYGDSVMNTAGTVCADVNTLITFAARAATTTPAGVYSATEAMIATGTF